MTKLASLDDSVVYYVDLLYSFLNEVCRPAAGARLVSYN